MQSARDFARGLAGPKRGKTKTNGSVAATSRSAHSRDDIPGKFALGYRPGWSLPGPFYYAPEVYRADLDRIWRKGWLFAGHACEIPRAGDYFLVEIDADSLVIIRGEQGAIRAFHNVCRHRGSLI